MKHVICTFAPASRNEHRVYFLALKKYAVTRETACFFYVLDELGYERRVSKKTSNETGFKAGHAAEFSEIMEQDEAVDTVEAAAARRQYAAFTAEEKAEAEAMNTPAKVEVYAMYATISDSICAYGSVYQITKIEPMVDGTLITFNGKTELFGAGETILIVENTAPLVVPAYQRTFYVYDAEDQAAIIEEDHAEALVIDAEINEIVLYAGESAPVQMDGDMN